MVGVGPRSRMLGSAKSLPDSAPGGLAELTYGSLRCRLTAPRPEPLTWLSEFLSPAFAVDSPQRRAVAADVAVTLEEDAARYANLAGSLPARAAPIDCFANDTHMIALPGWRDAVGVTIALHAAARVAYVVDAGAHRVAVVTPPDNPQARTALMRTVRELAMIRALAEGGAFLHAAALAHAGHGLLIAGVKRAGKTTLLLHVLEATGAEYVSNDRVLLPTGDAAAARGMPTIITVRAESRPFLGPLYDRLAGSGSHYRLTRAESVAPARRITPTDEIGVSPAQLCAALGVTMRADCIPRAIVFPVIDPAAGRPVFRALSEKDAAARIPAALLSATLDKKVSDLFRFPDDPPLPGAAQLVRVARAWAARIPCFTCAIGPDAYAHGALAAECIARLSR
jgi:hypothetical protein